MKFYNRENELAELQRIQELSFEENSRLTVVTGRRRIGKTSLIMRAFVWRANLCATFLGNLVYPTPASKMLHFP